MCKVSESCVLLQKELDKLKVEVAKETEQLQKTIAAKDKTNESQQVLYLSLVMSHVLCLSLSSMPVSWLVSSSYNPLPRAAGKYNMRLRQSQGRVIVFCQKL